MKADLDDLSIDLEVLVSSAQEDFDRKFWDNYERYLEQYNSILEALQNRGQFKNVLKIEPVPGGQKAYLGVGVSQAEKAKFREVLNSSKILHQKLKLLAGKKQSSEPSAINPRVVFVIHGRDLGTRDALFTFLRSIDLHPLEWSEAVSATGRGAPYVGEVLERAFSLAQAVVVLMTPDDEARLREPFRQPKDSSYETELTPQARPNVLFEAGMAIGRFPNRTILIQLGSLRPFSDIGGRHVIRLNNTTEKRQELAQRLRNAGCHVNLSGTDWHTAGNFGSHEE